MPAPFPASSSLTLPGASTSTLSSPSPDLTAELGCGHRPIILTISLRHRALLTSEQGMEGLCPDDVIRGILEQIEVPR